MLIATFALTLAACGNADEADEAVDAATETGSDETATTAEATTTTEAEATTTEAEPTTTEAEATTTTAEATEQTQALPEGAIAIELGEWFLSEPGDLTAGTFTFALSNTGENPHALAIARGTSYEDLPQLDNGAVDTDALGADFLGTTENIDSGGTATIDFELEAGDYVFFCPVQFGPNSHAKAGQVLSVTVG